MLLDLFNVILFCVIMFGLFGATLLVMSVAMWLFNIVAQVAVWVVILLLKIAAIIVVLYERYLK